MARSQGSGKATHIRRRETLHSKTVEEKRRLEAVHAKVDERDGTAGTRAPNRLIEAAYTKEEDRKAQTDERRSRMTQGATLGSLSRVGIMVYNQLASLDFADTYIEGCMPSQKDISVFKDIAPPTQKFHPLRP